MNPRMQRPIAFQPTSLRPSVPFPRGYEQNHVSPPNQMFRQWPLTHAEEMKYNPPDMPTYTDPQKSYYLSSAKRPNRPPPSFMPKNALNYSNPEKDAPKPIIKEAKNLIENSVSLLAILEKNTIGNEIFFNKKDSCDLVINIVERCKDKYFINSKENKQNSTDPKSDTKKAGKYFVGKPLVIFLKDIIKNRLKYGQ